MTAGAEAEAAARAAGIGIRAASPSELVPVIEAIWGPGRAGELSLLTAIDRAGNSLHLAERAGRPVGVAFGVLGWADGVHLHSHIVGVVPGVRARGIGFAIKLAQRAECLAHDVTEMRWTFDPLIRRNAHFNLVKLGATVREYLPDFYGRLDDAVNGNDATDRLEVSWRLDAPVGAPPSPVATEFVLPEDYEALREKDAVAATALRRAGAEFFARAPRLAFTGEGWASATHQSVDPSVAHPRR